MIMSEEEMDEQLDLYQAMHESVDNIKTTGNDVQKLEYELQRVQSENRDLKELIIKLLFDRYGF